MHKIKADTAKENRAMQIIRDLPEIVAYRQRVQAAFPDVKTHTGSFISAEPDSSFKYYWVKVGLSDAIRFTTEYNFYVDTTDMSVSYYDTMTDSVIPLEQWRKGLRHSAK